MRLFFILFFVFCQLSRAAYSQTDQIGSGRALVFDGIDDYVDFGDIYNDQNLPFTISAWVYIDSDFNSGAPIFCTNDNFDIRGNIYRGFWFSVARSVIQCEVGDGRGGNNPAFRRGKSASVGDLTGRWVHVAVVMNQSIETSSIYLNGVDVGGSVTGGSTSPMANSFVGDKAKSGHMVSNNGTTWRTKGKLDELRLYNRALSEMEIRSTMCVRLSGNETGLIGYWNFDETGNDVVYDKSSNHFDGQLVNNVQRVYSGAPVGDASTYRYGSSWNGIEMTLGGQSRAFTVSDITGNPEGVQLYQINSFPSQQNGLNASIATQPYYGVFSATINGAPTFNADLTSFGVSACAGFNRNDNSSSLWDPVQANAVWMQRGEFLYNQSEETFDVDLGEDKLICDLNSYQLSVSDELHDKNITWSTGETTPTIVATTSGDYRVKVEGSCSAALDTIRLSFMKSPLDFTLGPDMTICEGTTHTLVYSNGSSIGFNMVWSDGVTEMPRTITQAGDYALTISNECGTASDTVTISLVDTSFSDVPNVITPNNDGYNDFLILDESLQGSYLKIVNRWGIRVYESTNYSNDWNGGDLASGVYYLKIKGTCGEDYKGHITIAR